MRTRASRLLIGVLLLTGCSSTIRFNIYPPGARVSAVGRSCMSPCALEAGTIPHDHELHYRIEKDPLYRAADGVIRTKIAPGRVVGAIFTLGIVAAARGIYYVPPSRAQLERAFDPGPDLAFINEHGTGRIEGQAFTETRGGEIRHAAGDTITLRPDTPYVRDGVQYVAFEVPQAEGAVTSDPDLAFLGVYKRQTIGDAEGRFAFESLAPGKYILSAVISWEAPGAEFPALQMVSVVGFADVRPDATVKTLVTDWTAQQRGIGRHGETMIPDLSPDAENLGQRRLPQSE